jgi:hypothetical protein
VSVNEVWNRRAAMGRIVGNVDPLSDDELEDLVRRLSGHYEAGEEEVFLGTSELAQLLREVLNHRQGSCPGCSREHVKRERVWGV